VAAGGAEKAQLGLSPAGDDVQRDAEDLLRLLGKLVAVAGGAHRLGGAREYLVIAMPASLGQDLAHRPQRLLLARADLAGARDLGPELRHLDVVRDVVELVAARDVGDEDMDGVGPDVERSQTRHCSSLESGSG
jgi:hypothetical protein